MYYSLMKVKNKYLIFDGRYYKIGESVSPKIRLSAIKSANPTATLLTSGTGASEIRLHRLYKGIRINGEWFDLSSDEAYDVISLIDGVNNETQIGKHIYSKYKMRFGGPYHGRFIKGMNSKEELEYITFLIQKLGSAKKSTYALDVKIFEWWIEQCKNDSLVCSNKDILPDLEDWKPSMLGFKQGGDRLVPPLLNHHYKETQVLQVNHRNKEIQL